jgi:hypothetical protein
MSNQEGHCLALALFTLMSFATSDENLEQAQGSLPNFLELINRTGPGIRKETGSRFLDDVDVELHEESLATFLAMKTGYVYLGCKFLCRAEIRRLGTHLSFRTAMGVLGVSQVVKNIASRQTSFREIAASLAGNVPRRVNGMATIGKRIAPSF